VRAVQVAVLERGGAFWSHAVAARGQERPSNAARNALLVASAGLLAHTVARHGLLAGVKSALAWAVPVPISL